MTASAAFALSLSIAAGIMGLAHLAVWRAERRGCWGSLALSCLLALVFFLFEAAFPVPTPVRPSPVAASLGFAPLILGWLGVASYLDLPRATLVRLATAMLLVALATTGLILLDALSRVQVFSGYAMLTLMVVGTAWRHVPPRRRRAHVVLFGAALVYPLFVGLAAADVINLAYIRYVLSIPTMLLAMTMLVEGMLLAQRRTRAAAEQALAAQNRLSEVLQAMARGSGDVAATGKTMSEGAQLLAMRTDEQTSHIRETAEAVRGVVQQVQLTSGHVAAVDAECQRLDAQARHGSAEVADTVAAIQRIEQRTHEMSEALVLIESVAFQTNLLALNAAIEAARAGNAGRGFAVVAGEVRALSQRTSASAGQVRTLIERARDQSTEGVHKVEGVRGTLADMTGSVKDVATRMREVAADAEHQRASLDAILGHLDALTRLTDANASMVAQSVMSSDEMNHSARALTDIVAQVQGTGAVQAPPTAAAAPRRETAEVEFF